MKIDVGKRKGWQWIKNKNIYSCGQAYFENKYYSDDDFSNLLLKKLSNNADEEIICDFINRLNGFFAIIIDNKDSALIFCDHVRTIPIFWKEENGNFIITDSLEPSSNCEFDELSINEFLALGYVTGNDTLLKNVKQLASGEYAIIKKGKPVSVKRYTQFKYSYEKHDKEIWFNKLDAIYSLISDRLIHLASGKTIVIPLSGGHDSRLLLYYLVEKKYNNIITYTYGRKNNSEAEVSRKVAEYLGVKWYFVEYRTKDLQNLFYDKVAYSAMANYCGNCFTVPLIQEWLAVQTLTKKNMIPKDSIIATGYSHDMLNGSHLISEDISYDDIIPRLFKGQFVLWDWAKSSKKNHYIKVFSKKLHYILDPLMSKNEAVHVAEMFDFMERQTKHINNAVRIYELFGYKWVLPFWDKDLINLWLSVPKELRRGRKLFLDFTMWKYPQLMKDVPVAKSTATAIKNKISKSKILLSLGYKLKWIYKAILGKKTDGLNYYGYLSNYEYLNILMKYKSTSYYFMFSVHYLEYLEKNYNIKGAKK